MLTDEEWSKDFNDEFNELIEETSPLEMYPTDWQMYDGMGKEEIRKTSADTYQLRTPEGILTLNQEGFNLYRDDKSAFLKWADEHHIQIEPRGKES